jgi:hypothetical protein
MDALMALRSDRVPGDPPNRTGAAGPEGVAVAARAWAAPEALPDDPDAVAGPGPGGPSPGVPRRWREAGLAGSGPGSAAGGGEREWSDRAPPREPPPLPVRLTPLTLSDLLDGAWAIIACRPRTVLGLSALFIVPAELVASFLIRGHGAVLDQGTIVAGVFPFVRTDRASRSVGFALGAMAAVAVLSLAYSLLGAALGRLVAAWYDDTDLTVGAVLAATLRATPAVLVAWVLTSVVQVAALYLLLLPALVAFPLFLLVAPVITIEKRGPFAAIRRSAGLVRRRYLAVTAIWLISLVLERVIDLALAAGAEFVSDITPGAVAEIVRPAGWAFALFVTAPTVAGLSVLLYYDLRVRSEGLDLEVEAADAFAPRGRPDGS